MSEDDDSGTNALIKSKQLLSIDTESTALFTEKLEAVFCLWYALEVKSIELLATGKVGGFSKTFSGRLKPKTSISCFNTKEDLMKPIDALSCGPSETLGLNNNELAEWL